MKSRSDHYEGLAAAVCKEGLPGHAVLHGLVSILDAAVAEAERHDEPIPASVRRALALLAAWRDGSGRERDLVAASAVLEQERQAYVLLWNEKMARAFERKAAGEDPKYPTSTFLRHLSDATAFCLGMAPGLVPRGETCNEGSLWTVLKDLQATFLVLSDDRRSMASDRAAGRAMASALRAGVRAAPLDPPPASYVLIPPKTQAQLEFDERLRRERFMGAMGCPVDDPSATLLGCAVPAPEDDGAGHQERVADAALDDLGLVRHYGVDEVLPSVGRLQRAMERLGVGEPDPALQRRPNGRRPMTEAQLMDLFLAERDRFAESYPAVSEASLVVSDDACNGGRSEPCPRRDVAECTWKSRPDGRKMHQKVVLVRRVLSMPRANVVAVLRHELGHLCDPRALEDGAEKRADRIALEVTGEPIRYDDGDLQTTGAGRNDRPPHLRQ
jgi:hypothetical protein